MCWKFIKFFLVIYITFISRIYSTTYIAWTCSATLTNDENFWEKSRKIFGTPCIYIREKHTWAFNRGGRSGLRLFLEGIASVGSWKAIRAPVNPLLPRFYGGDVVNALRRRPAIGSPPNEGRGRVARFRKPSFCLPLLRKFDNG